MGHSKEGRGGRRAGAGRKPGPLKKIKDEILARGDDAVFAYTLYTREMRNESNDLKLRLDCAKEVLDRNWGKPRQSVEHTGEDGGDLTIKVIYVNRDRNRDADPPPGSDGGGGLFSTFQRISMR